MRVSSGSMPNANKTSSGLPVAPSRAESSIRRLIMPSIIPASSSSIRGRRS